LESATLASAGFRTGRLISGADAFAGISVASVFASSVNFIGSGAFFCG
jgi:hypothetical protein